MYIKKCQFFLLALSSVFSIAALADIQPRSSSLSYSQKQLSNAGNPAAAALIIERNDPHVLSGGIIEIGAGLEYGDLDELFNKIDELRDDFNPAGDSNVPELPPIPENPIRDYTWDELFNEYPDLEDRLDVIGEKLTTTASLLAAIASEGYAKADITSEASFVLNESLYGGTLIFGASFKGNSQVVGLAEDINFDKEQARTELERLPHFLETDPTQELDLSGGITLFFNPENKNTKVTFDNDSLLLVKATKISQLSLSYSRKLQHFESGDLYWGVKPVFYRVGLTNVSTRIGEITDSEKLFEDIKDANYVYENGFDIDLGLVWAAPYYQVGASLTNLIENSYKFPSVDRQGFSSDIILQKLDFHEEFTMQRQLKLDVGIYTKQRHWSLHAEVEANPVESPMRDEYQWFTLTGGYASDSWWLPSARLGISRNLAGTKLGYINAGVTVMKFVNIDVATTLDTVRLDGDELRRGFNIRLGIQFEY
jgi:hypothetical protein